MGSTHAMQHPEAIGWVCSYIPEELIIASGLTPYRLLWLLAFPYYPGVLVGSLERCDCKKSFLQPQWSVARGQWSVKSETYDKLLALEAVTHDFLQVRLERDFRMLAVDDELCSVFAESEVVSLIAEDTPAPLICRGICRSVAKRTLAMLDRIGREPKIAMSGGVAYNQGVVRELERELSQKLFIPDRPQTLGALGAALFARDLEQ